MIRPAQLMDCPAIAGIEARCFGHDDVELLRGRCELQVAHPERLLLAAVAGDEVIGFARVRRTRRTPEAAPDALPDGWYLAGIAVLEAWRRRGIGRALTERRLRWIAERAGEAYYFTDAGNRASLDLHRELGFVEITRHFTGPHLSFRDGEGVLSRIDVGTTRVGPADR